MFHFHYKKNWFSYEGNLTSIINPLCDAAIAESTVISSTVTAPPSREGGEGVLNFLFI
jgi:hypothetical protein